MKVEQITSEEMVLQYVEGCLNDFEAGLTSKDDTASAMIELIVHLIKLDINNKPAGKAPN